MTSPILGMLNTAIAPRLPMCAVVRVPGCERQLHSHIISAYSLRPWRASASVLRCQRVALLAPGPWGLAGWRPARCAFCWAPNTVFIMCSQ